MGAFSTKILGNDTGLDIYDEFYQRYNKKEDVQDILSDIKSQYLDNSDDTYEDRNSIIFAIVKALWEVGFYEEELYNEVKETITSGKDIELWKELGADEKDLEKRKEVLQSFLEKISTLNPKPKKPKSKRISPTLYEKGDCLLFQYSDGDYGVIVVADKELVDEYLWVNTYIPLFLKHKTIPSIDEIKKAKVLMETSFGNSLSPDIFSDSLTKKDIKELTEITRVIYRLNIGNFNKTSSSFLRLLAFISLYSNPLYLKNLDLDKLSLSDIVNIL